MPHIIRLREPWTRTPLQGGGVRWSRRFNRPTGLETGDGVSLDVDGLPAGASVRVNSQSPGPASSVEPSAPSFDVAPLLADANFIEIDLPLTGHAAATSSSPPFDVRLVIVARA